MGGEVTLVIYVYRKFNASLAEKSKRLGHDITVAEVAIGANISVVTVERFIGNSCANLTLNEIDRVMRYLELNSIDELVEYERGSKPIKP